MLDKAKTYLNLCSLYKQMNSNSLAMENAEKAYFESKKELDNFLK